MCFGDVRNVQIVHLWPSLGCCAPYSECFLAQSTELNAFFLKFDSFGKRNPFTSRERDQIAATVGESAGMPTAPTY